MSELAFNMNGEPFEVPAAATGWRVRRMKHKGAPEVVYGRDGVPLVIPIESDLDDLRREVGDAPGRYRVDPVDGHRPLAGAPSGYVFVHDGDAPVALTSAALPPPSDHVVVEAMRMNAEIARSVVDRFPQMLEAAAVLLRAADGAGLPKRAPAADLSDDEAVVEPKNESQRGDLFTLLAPLVQMLATGIMNGNVELPDLGALLDWRKAKPARKPATREPRIAAPATAADAAPIPDLPPISPATMQHFMAIQAALDPKEAALAREVARDLDPLKLREWFDELIALSVPDAVAKVRSLIAGSAGGAA